MKTPYFLAVFSVLIGSPLVMAAQEADAGRPTEHFCPITANVMVDPVVAADGHSYEREAIMRWFATAARRSPLSNAPLDHTNLTANISLKKMIGDWQPGRNHEPSVLDSKPAADIARGIREEFERNKRLLASARGKHIVAFLGNTGSGKSTLVNLLAGKGLVVGPDGDDYILADPTDAGAMVIGTRGNSETLYPKFIDVNDLRFFDLPGFNDTDGSERNLVNAAFIRQILLEAASVRLVFVAGQDQFTADRSASIKRMFNSIKQLFVVDGQGDTFVDDGVFIATKVTCSDGANIPEYLVKRTDARDKEELTAQLQSWNRANRLCHVFHPVRGNNNAEAASKILELIQRVRPTKIVGVNVSALYPPETVKSLERMFSNMMEEALARKLGVSLTTVSDYDRAIASWTFEDFWGNFDTELCAEQQAAGLLKEFCINPYKKTLVSFERENVRNRQDHIQTLKDNRKKRIVDVEGKTGTRTTEVIRTLVPRAEREDFVPFDFAYHKDFYEHVCGAESIAILATDPKEQEIVRRCYADLISRHSHGQMTTWMERFSGIAEVTRRLALVEEQLQARQALTSASAAASGEVIPRPVPEIARGHEDFYRRFINGKLIYKPDPNSDTGRIEMPFAALANPLEGTFDLSRCGDTGQHLSISTGYRKAKSPANASKVEVWIAPRFVIEKELGTTAAQFAPIMSNWDNATSPLGLFWTWGGWDLAVGYHFLTSQTTEQIAAENLLLNYNKSAHPHILMSAWYDVDRYTMHGHSRSFQCFYVN